MRTFVLIVIFWSLAVAAWGHGYWFAMRRAAARFVRSQEEQAASRASAPPPGPDSRSFKLDTIQFRR